MNIHNVLSCKCDQCDKYWEEFKTNVVSFKLIEAPTGQIFKLGLIA